MRLTRTFNAGYDNLYLSKNGKRIDPMSIYKEPEQEPWVCECGADSYLACKCAIKSPPQRKPLTNEEERKAFVDWCFFVGLMAQSHGLRSESSDCDTAWKAWKARAAHGIKGKA